MDPFLIVFILVLLSLTFLTLWMVWLHREKPQAYLRVSVVMEAILFIMVVLIAGIKAAQGSLTWSAALRIFFAYLILLILFNRFRRRRKSSHR